MQAAHTHVLQDNGVARVQRNDRVIADLMACGLNGREILEHATVEFDSVIVAEIADGVVAKSASECEDVISVPAGELVVAAAAPEDVIAISAGENVIAGPGAENIVAVPSVEYIVAAPAHERVVAISAGDVVVAVSTGEVIIAVAAIDDVITWRPA